MVFVNNFISKGTVIDSESLDESEFNYIGNIMDFDTNYGVCYTDITTGIIYVSLLNHNNVNLVSEIVSLGLKEVVVNDKIDKSIISTLKNQFKISITFNEEIIDNSEYEYIYKDITDYRYINTN